MAAIVTSESVAVNILLNDGVTAAGSVKTVSISLGSLNKAAFDADKVMAIVNLLSPCLAKNVEQIVKIETSQIEDD